MRIQRAGRKSEPSLLGPRATNFFPWTVLAVTIAMDCIAILPAGLVGVLALAISEDLDVAPTTLGLVVSAYFLAGSLAAALLGSHIDRVGPRRAAMFSGLVSIGCLSFIALVPWDSAWLLGFAAALGGSAMAITMPSTNAVLGAVVHQRQRMIAVCAKQAAVPIALAGAAATITVAEALGGWRPVFGGTAGLGIVILLLFKWRTNDAPPRLSSAPAQDSRAGRTAQRAILRVGISSMLASLLAGTLTGYAAISLHEAGVTPAGTAIVLAVSNAAGIMARLVSGWWAQRRNATNLRTVAAMMVAGGIGAGLMAVGSPVTVSIGSVVAFGLGWGWSALTYAVILELNLDNPGATGAVIQSGGMAGSGTGPLIMAALVGTFSLAAGWLVVGCAAVGAGVLIWRYQPPG